jgi:hypothetical protein
MVFVPRIPLAELYLSSCFFSIGTLLIALVTTYDAPGSKLVSVVIEC